MSNETLKIEQLTKQILSLKKQNDVVLMKRSNYENDKKKSLKIGVLFF